MKVVSRLPGGARIPCLVRFVLSCLVLSCLVLSLTYLVLCIKLVLYQTFLVSHLFFLTKFDRVHGENLALCKCKLNDDKSNSFHVSSCTTLVLW
jgi:hypothetical protein